MPKSRSAITISELWIYPIKSLGGIQLQQAQLSPRGLQWDRRWMLLDQEGNFLTQRQHAKMALITLRLEAGALQVGHQQKSLPALSIPLEMADPGASVQAPIWEDTTLAWYVGKQWDEWFSEALEQPCRLVYMPEESERTTLGKKSGREQKVSFADSYPLLLTGQASLNDLNTRLPAPVPMNRFRPNIVVKGCAPFAEDRWHEFWVRELHFWAEKPCGRCTVITIDQKTAEKEKEPLQTLSRYRRTGNKVLFGQYLLCDSEGTLRVGDQIEVRTYKNDPFYV